MKLFQRTAKDTAELPEVSMPKATRSGPGARPELKSLVPAFAISVLGVAAAGALLWGTLFGSAEQTHRQQLAGAWAESQAGSLRQALAQLAADTRAMASNPDLLPALSDPTRSHALESTLAHGHMDGLLDVYLNANGAATQDANRPGPLNYAALDMLHRVEMGQSVAPEAYRNGQRWLVYSATALRAQDNSVQGTLLLVVDLQRLLNALPPMASDVGQLTLAQKFGNSPAQTLLQRGEASDAPALNLSSGNPNWQLSFVPGQSITATLYSPALLAIATLLALSGGLLGIYLSVGGLQRRLRIDAQTLGQFIQELGGQRSAKAPELSLSVLQPLAQALARQPRRKTETNGNGNGTASPVAPIEAVPVKAEAYVRAAATPETQLVDPLFQNTDILDIDILDEDQDLLGLEQNPAMSTPKAPQLPASIFRAYDIRGVVGDTLTAETAYWVGRAIGSESLARGEPCVNVGRDGRLSGPELVQQLIQGLLDCGCQVTDIGMVPTPVLYFAANVLEGKSGVMLTGSHNPPNYNGFKIVVAGETLANEQIQALRERIENNDLASGVGSVQQVDILPRYFKQIRDDIPLAKPLKVVVDCGNGVAGVIAPQLIEALGCTVIPLFCDVDGTFPNHHPDPGKPENLEDLIAKVKETGADLGLAFDGDGDRVGVVTNEGTIIYPDRLLMLFAKDVVSRNPGADIIFDVKCTRRLISLISGYGGRPVMWKTGHSLIKKKMKETGALLAGEMSGHIFFKERWFGFDDGIYSAARLLEIISQDKRDSEHVFSAFPLDVSTPEINITVTDESKFTLIDALQRNGQWGEANLTTLDGVRVDYPKGWGLVRASNTTPVLVLRFEADSEAELERIKDVFRSQLKAVDPALTIPF